MKPNLRFESETGMVLSAPAADKNMSVAGAVYGRIMHF
jgi:hypothetical protein